jgi:hypothetical protein
MRKPMMCDDSSCQSLTVADRHPAQSLTCQILHCMQSSPSCADNTFVPECHQLPVWLTSDIPEEPYLSEIHIASPHS